jgi:hypothetical protein
MRGSWPNAFPASDFPLPASRVLRAHWLGDALHCSSRLNDQEQPIELPQLWQR